MPKGRGPSERTDFAQPVFGKNHRHFQRLLTVATTLRPGGIARARGDHRWFPPGMGFLIRTADGSLISDSIEEAITILEHRFQRDEEPYRRMVLEMVLVQQKTRSRIVRRVIPLVKPLLNRPTEPWRQFISAHSLAESFGRLAAEQPAHPLLAVFPLRRRRRGKSRTRACCQRQPDIAQRLRKATEVAVAGYSPIGRRSDSWQRESGD